MALCHSAPSSPRLCFDESADKSLSSFCDAPGVLDYLTPTTGTTAKTNMRPISKDDLDSPSALSDDMLELGLVAGDGRSFTFFESPLRFKTWETLGAYIVYHPPLPFGMEWYKSGAPASARLSAGYKPYCQFMEDEFGYILRILKPGEMNTVFIATWISQQQNCVHISADSASTTSTSSTTILTSNPIKPKVTLGRTPQLYRSKAEAERFAFLNEDEYNENGQNECEFKLHVVPLTDWLEQQQKQEPPTQ